MKKFCVILAGCGHKDGAEINEAVFSLLAMSQQNIQYDICAPNRQAYHNINHYSDFEFIGRNMLAEAARIARGNIKPLEDIITQEYDALIIPGGFGALKNFTNFPAENNNWLIKDDIKKIILDFYNNNKPIGAICIAPSILAMLLKNEELTVTVGENENSKELIAYTNADIQLNKSTEIVVDEKRKIVSTPAFMNDASLAEVFIGIYKLIEKVNEIG